MEVKDVIISALNILGRGELATKLSQNNELDEEGAETVNTLLYCFNAVEDELARKYMPLSTAEDLTSHSGKYYYTDFAHTPVKIKRVLANGKEIGFTLLTEYMSVNASKITVEYEFAPSKKQLDGTSDFGLEISENLIALGIAAEYCLINGEIEAAELWEKKYRSRIDFAQSRLPSCRSLPPRRWV